MLIYTVYSAFEIAYEVITVTVSYTYSGVFLFLETKSSVEIISQIKANNWEEYDSLGWLRYIEGICVH